MSCMLLFYIGSKAIDAPPSLFEFTCKEETVFAMTVSCCKLNRQSSFILPKTRKRIDPACFHLHFNLSSKVGFTIESTCWYAFHPRPSLDTSPSCTLLPFNKIVANFCISSLSFLIGVETKPARGGL